MHKILMNELLKRTNMTRSQVYVWIKEGKLNGTKISNHWEFDEDEVNKFLKSDYFRGFIREMGDTSMFRRIPNIEECYPYNLLRVLLDMDEERDVEPPAIDIWDIDVRSLRQHLALLHDRERKVIELRYQFGLTLDEIGNVIGVTRERVRQIQLKAERRLRYWIKIGTCRLVSLIDYNELKQQNRELEAKIIDLSLKLERYVGNESKEKLPIQAKDIPIETLGFSVRAYNCLKRANINTLQDIISFDAEQDKYNQFNNRNWLGIRNIGRVTMKEIAKCVLDNCGYQLRKFDPGTKAYVGTFLQDEEN